MPTSTTATAPAQVADGLRTDYVQDVAAPLPQVLTARQGGSVTKYLRGLGLIGEEQGGAWQYPLPDALGSVRQLVDVQGQVQVANRFDPFGGLESVAGQGRSAYGFAGEEQDEDTGHLFLRARTYNPETGRFLQQDSVLGDPTQPQSLHRYAYGFSNPVNYTDPSGLMPPINAAPVIGNQSAATRDAMYRHFIQNSQSYAPTAPTQVSPQAQYAAQVRRPGFNSTALSRPDGGIPRVQVARSVNGHNWQTQSDPLAREQSRGQRPRGCSFTDVLVGLGSAAVHGQLLGEAFEFAMQSPDILQQMMSQEQWLHLIMGSVIIGGAMLTIGWAALPLIVAGGAIGGGLGLGLQVWDNYRSERPLLGNIDWGNVAWAAFDGAVAGAIAAIIQPLLPGGGSGLMGALGTGVGEFIAGRVTQVGLNVINGRSWNEDLWNLRDIALDVIPGVGAAPLASAAGKAFRGAGRGVRGAAGAVGDVVGRAGRSLDNFSTQRQIKNRLRNLDDFTGGTRRTISANEMRARLTGNSGRGALSQRLAQQRVTQQLDGISPLARWRWHQASFDVRNPKIQNLIRAGYNPKDVITLYRGQGGSYPQTLSPAARSGGLEYSQRLFEGDLAKRFRDDPSYASRKAGIDPSAYEDDLALLVAAHKGQQHRAFPNPLVAMTADISVAAGYARASGGHPTILEIVIPRDKVHSVDKILGGRNSFKESEYIIPNHIPDEYIVNAHTGNFQVLSYGQRGDLSPALPGTDTVILGHYALPIKITVNNGVFIRTDQYYYNVLEKVLNPVATQLNGRTLASVPGHIGAIGPHLNAADRIIFFTSPGMRGLTNQELRYILNDPELIKKTVFILDGTSPSLGALPGVSYSGPIP